MYSVFHLPKLNYNEKVILKAKCACCFLSEIGLISIKNY